MDSGAFHFDCEKTFEWGTMVITIWLKEVLLGVSWNWLRKHYDSQTFLIQLNRQKVLGVRKNLNILITRTFLWLPELFRRFHETHSHAVFPFKTQWNTRVGDSKNLSLIPKGFLPSCRGFECLNLSFPEPFWLQKPFCDYKISCWLTIIIHYSANLICD